MPLFNTPPYAAGVLVPSTNKPRCLVDAQFAVRLSGLLLQVSRSLLQAKVALLVGTAGTEANTDKGGPCSSLEQKDRENDTETETERRLDEEVGEAAVPLELISTVNLCIDC